MKEKHMKAMEDWARAVNESQPEGPIYAYYTVTREPLADNAIRGVELQVINSGAEEIASIRWELYWCDDRGIPDTESEPHYLVPLNRFNEKASRANLPPLTLEP